MGMDAGISITFYDKDSKKMKVFYEDCYKMNSTCATFSILEGATKIRVCFSTEYDKCAHSDDESSDTCDEEEGEEEGEKEEESS